jgi:hypothetical protein
MASLKLSVWDTSPFGVSAVTVVSLIQRYVETSNVQLLLCAAAGPEVAAMRAAALAIPRSDLFAMILSPVRSFSFGDGSPHKEFTHGSICARQDIP